MGSIPVLSVIVLLSTPPPATSMLPGGPGKGSITVRPEGAITKLEVNYNISQLLGEPTVSGVYRWSSDTVEKLDPTICLWLKVENLSETATAWIKASPTVPKKGEWGSDVAGSPDWDEVLVSTWSGTKAEKCWPPDRAKAFWKEGFKVIDARLSKKY